MRLKLEVEPRVDRRCKGADPDSESAGATGVTGVAGGLELSRVGLRRGVAAVFRIKGGLSETGVLATVGRKDLGS